MVLAGRSGGTLSTWEAQPNRSDPGKLIGDRRETCVMGTITLPPTVDLRPDVRDQLSRLYALFALSLMMFRVHDEDEVFRLAISAVPSLGPFRVASTYRPRPGAASAPEAWLSGVPVGNAGEEGLLAVDAGEDAWAWGYALRSFGRVHGYLVAVADDEPNDHEQFLLKALMHQTAAAMSNAAMYHDALETTEHVRVISEERAAVNDRLQRTVAELERQERTHERLAEASASDGVFGLVEALHELTGLRAVVEDQFGNVQARAGPDRERWPRKPSAGRLAEIERRIAATHGRPVWIGGRIVAWAKPGHEVLGVISLLDPRHTGGGYEIFALEQASLLLAVELAHQRGVAELELRLRRELVDDLLSGGGEASAYDRAAALGHDLHGQHYVVSLRWRGQFSEHTVATAAERGLGRQGIRSWLLTRRNRMCVLILPGRPDPTPLYRRIAAELGSQHCSLGVGGVCDSPAQIPRSYEESVRAVRIRESSRSPDGATSFADLGIYRILGTPETHHEVEAFVAQWLGPLLAYDARRHTQLMYTLAQYLDCGGNYDQAAAALVIHRSTLRYRLRRIRELTNLDLADVDTRLNLHLATRAWKFINLDAPASMGT